MRKEKQAVAKRKAFIDDLIANPEKYKQKWDAEIRAERPDMTDEQNRGSWNQLANQFGLKVDATPRDDDGSRRSLLR